MKSEMSDLPFVYSYSLIAMGVCHPMHVFFFFLLTFIVNAILYYLSCSKLIPCHCSKQTDETIMAHERRRLRTIVDFQICFFLWSPLGFGLALW